MAIFTTPIARVGDDNFRVGAGYKLNFYAAGTSSFKDTYTDNTYTTAHANPVIADGAGRFPVIWTSGDYKVVLTTDLDVVVWTVDNYTSDSGSSIYAEGVLSAAGSAADVITANLPTAPSALADQQQVVVELQHGANTIGNPTFNLNSLGAKVIKRDDTKPLRAGDTGGDGNKIYLSYSAANDAWVLLNPAQKSKGVGKSWCSGLQINTGTDALHDIDVSSGQVADSADSVVIDLKSDITKQIDAVWAEGTNAGGFPSGLNSGAPAINTWYRVFLIMKADGTTDCGFDSDASATNLLADASGYTFYRRIGWIKTDGSSDMIPWILNKKHEYVWDVMQSNYNSTGNTSGAVLGVTCPPALTAMLSITIRTQDANQYFALITNTGQTNSVPSDTLRDVAVGADGTNTAYDTALVFRKVTNTSQIRHRANASSPTLKIDTVGWLEDLEIS